MAERPGAPPVQRRRAMRIPADRPAGLLRLVYHQPDRRERELLDALASEQSRDQAFLDHASYLANVWMPHHPVRAAIESRLQERKDRQARRQDPEPDAGKRPCPPAPPLLAPLPPTPP